LDILNHTILTSISGNKHFLDYSEFAEFDFASKYLSVSTDCISSGINWTYSYIEYIYAYNYKLIYFNFLNNFFDDSLDLFFVTLHYLSTSTISLQLVWSYILDIYISNSLEKSILVDNWYKGFIKSQDVSLFVLSHPEIIFVNSQFSNNLISSFFSEKCFSICELIESESFLPAVMLLPQLLFIIFISTIFICFYFSHYSSPVKEESLVDSDYLISNMTVECEKELGSIDDYLLTILTFSYIFGWYFYINF